MSDVLLHAPNDTAQDALLEHMCDLITPLIDRDGYMPTALDGVQLMALHGSHPRTPLVYEPGLIIIAQGEKTGYLGERVIHYGAGHYLVQAMPVPFECETYATPQAPMLGVLIGIDMIMLGELIQVMPTAADNVTPPDPMTAVTLTPAMGHGVVHLLECLHDEVMRRALGRQRIREVLFEALRGPQGESLRQLLQQQTQYGRIGRALETLHRDYTQPLSVETLAEKVNMSPSAFHHHFKRFTRLSPLQYQKRIRLLKARAMIAARTHNVSSAASAVGYQSASQFSREYKRYFGIQPAGDQRLGN
ncbi:AraC family transcriptional regulator [Kushneria pakistanensis]|uniref:AraC family transcriptional regulator n=1 Tax=Kushneria pakistanensis TaxID=1508770 RepID=A0ABQ3FAC9_9GAMM|nr:AraC family transcriptional regulator [Kushneria pakistanensis]GHC15822.1 AraC family transcriptional regulator [Kushneria pakistanensis]